VEFGLIIYQVIMFALLEYVLFSIMVLCDQRFLAIRVVDPDPAGSGIICN
jgi:hypothetical protein